MLVVLTNVFQFWKIRYYIRRHIVCKGYILYINIYNIYIYTIYISIHIIIIAIIDAYFFHQTPTLKRLLPSTAPFFAKLQEEAKEVHTALMMALLGSQWISAESFHRNLAHTPLKTNISPGKMMVGRCISYWNSPFLGGHVNFQGCRLATEGYRSHQTLKMGRFCLFVYVYIL